MKQKRSLEVHLRCPHRRLGVFPVYPPTSRDLIQQFSVARGKPGRDVHEHFGTGGTLQKAGTNSEFANLREAIGTNDIENYFPVHRTRRMRSDPTTFILNQLQRDAAGKIKLGLDLQGGTSFLVEMDTNTCYRCDEDDTNSDQRERHQGALSQAVDVLRKRVDQFGVAEPVIQPAGGNQILIQLPGLSQSDKDSAVHKSPRPPIWNSAW